MKISDEAKVFLLDIMEQQGKGILRIYFAGMG